MDDTQRAWSDPDPDEPTDLARLHGMEHTPRPLVEWCPTHGPYHAPPLDADCAACRDEHEADRAGTGHHLDAVWRRERAERWAS